jgi:hypothetical protein
MPDAMASGSGSRMQLVHELRRRNVLRMAGVYLVAAGLVVQVDATLLPVFARGSIHPRADRGGAFDHAVFRGAFGPRFRRVVH